MVGAVKYFLKGTKMRALLNKSLGFMVFVGAGLAFNAVPFAFFDLITNKEAIAVISICVITVTMASLVKSKI
jgi:hypothetical protein